MLQTDTRERRPCAWALKNPQKNLGHGDACHGWSCRHDAAKCDRKSTWERVRKAEASSYRKFPGNDVQQARSAKFKAMVDSFGVETLSAEQWEIVHAETGASTGTCLWCAGQIMKGGDGDVLDKRRTWHSGKGSEPDCLWDFYCHTRQPEQLVHLLRTQGPSCAGCGEVAGRWSHQGEVDPVERRARTDPYWRRVYPAETYAGAFCPLAWSSGFEVDHALALALVVLQVRPADQWRYWGPMNLQGLCSGCHKSKTAEDVRKIRAARALAEIPEAI